MTKRRPTITRHPERTTHGDFLLDSGPADRHWLLMRDWMGRMEHRFEAMEQRFATMEHRFEAMEQRFETMEHRFRQMELRFEKVEHRLETVEYRVGRIEHRLDEHIARTDERFSRVERQIAALTISVTELTTTVAGIDRRLRVVEGKVDDLMAWKHRIWGVVVALGMLSGVAAFAANLLARHIVG